MKVQLELARLLFVEIGFRDVAPNWDAVKLKAKLGKLGRVIHDPKEVTPTTITSKDALALYEDIEAAAKKFYALEDGKPTKNTGEVMEFELLDGDESEKKSALADDDDAPPALAKVEAKAEKSEKPSKSAKAKPAAKAPAKAPAKKAGKSKPAAKAPAKKSAPRADVETDRFGAREGTTLAKVNAILSKTPMKTNEIIKKTKVNSNTVYGQVWRLIKLGLLARGADGYYLTAKGIAK